MAIYIRKNRADILRQALRKLEEETPIRAIGPGSIARSFTEAIATELADFYDALDFNLAQSVISTASGSALELLGELYNTPRRSLSDLGTIDSQIGAFYFYVDQPQITDITIPANTRVSTAAGGHVGRQLSYRTTETTVIQAGRTKAYTGLRPEFSDAMFTAGADTLITHDFALETVSVRCRNPKPIAPQPGFEDDNSYRLRIMKSVRVAASGTEEAVRFAALAVPGVRQAKVRSALYGLGSFEILVTPENAGLSRASVESIREEVNKVRPVGSRMIFKTPTLTPMDIRVSLIIHRTIPTEDEIVGRETRVAILRYLNTLLPGDPLVYNRLIQAILDSSNLIKDAQVVRFAPNGVETLRRNYTTTYEEQVIPGRIEVSIA